MVKERLYNSVKLSIATVIFVCLFQVPSLQAVTLPDIAREDTIRSAIIVDGDNAATSEPFTDLDLQQMDLNADGRLDSADLVTYLNHPDVTDDDDDGFSEIDGDCLDNDILINPDAIEICENGIDENCSGQDYICTSLTIHPAGPLKLPLNGNLNLVAFVSSLSTGEWLDNTLTYPIVVNWQSSNENVVTVNEFGMLAGLALGTATVTARIPNTDVTKEVEISVESFAMTSMYLDPFRMAVDVGDSRSFDVSATDFAGAPISFQCPTTPQLYYDNTIISATFDGTIGAEKVNITALQSGNIVLQLECQGFFAPPVVIEVKPPVIIPDPSPGANGDFGVEPDLVVDGMKIHVVSYDQANNNLVYSTFNNTWVSETISGVGDYGRQSQIVLDPINNNRPLVCSLEDLGLSCWTLNEYEFWQKSVVDPIITDNVTAYNGEISLAVNSQGIAYLLYFDRDDGILRLATSTAASRDDWQVTGIGSLLNTDFPHCAVTIGPDDRPRIVFSLNGYVVYGAIDSSDSWVFELIDQGGTTPPPAPGIRLLIGTDNRPQVVYYKNGNLMHGIKIDGTWMTDVIETVDVSGNYDFGFDLNRHNMPRVSYYDSVSQTLRFAYKVAYDGLGTTNRWRFETPSGFSPAGQYSSLQVDDRERSHILYFKSGTPGYYVEPFMSDYTSVADADETTANTLAQVESDPVPFCLQLFIGEEATYLRGVAISGSHAIVGAYDEDYKGAAYVFERVNGLWVKIAKLTASDGESGDRFGESVSISGDRLVVGVYRDADNGYESGSAYVFERINGVWTEVAKLIPSDGESGDRFGGFVSISGDRLVAGAYGDDDDGSVSGSAYVFERINGVWTEVAKLTASDGEAGDSFGQSVSISGDRLVAGARYDDAKGYRSGSAYVFERINGVWTEAAKLAASDGEENEYFGNSLSISGDRLVAGVYRDADNGYESGSAYVFERINGVWTEVVKLTPSDGEAYDYFGESVSISGDRLVVGAYRDDDDEVDSGSVYVFERSDSSWQQTRKITPQNSPVSGSFGRFVSLSDPGTDAIVSGQDDVYIVR